MTHGNCDGYSRFHFTTVNLIVVVGSDTNGTTCVIAPQFELQPSPSEKALINAAYATKLESVTVVEGANFLFP